MDRDSQKQDILDVLKFTKDLLELLVNEVPAAHARQYRRVWETDVRTKLENVIKTVSALTDNSTETWGMLDDAGWGPEGARLKSDVIAHEAKEGRLGRVLKFLNSALGSLAKVFHPLEGAKELKDLAEPFADKLKEPWQPLTTIFGGGPIPGPPATPPPATT